MIKGVTLKPLKGERILLLPNFVSNGQFAIRRDCIVNSALFNDPATVQAAFGAREVCQGDEAKERSILPDWPLKPYRTTEWLFQPYRPKTIFRVLQADDGNIAMISTRYLALVRSDDVGSVFYGSDQNGPFCDADTVADINFIVMPGCLTDKEQGQFEGLNMAVNPEQCESCWKTRRVSEYDGRFVCDECEKRLRNQEEEEALERKDRPHCL